MDNSKHVVAITSTGVLVISIPKQTSEYIITGSQGNTEGYPTFTFNYPL